ncbi:MAG: hypothetical protein PHG69_03020, partial [Candidatus Omnitrophica bacterium]|nr:hypothetical protein [Candidatus Omnitrophota bacterium]
MFLRFYVVSLLSLLYISIIMSMVVKEFKKTAVWLFLFLFIVFTASGCATSRKKHANDIASQLAKMFALTESQKGASVIVGFKTLEDKRPKQEISYLSSIK